MKNATEESYKAVQMIELFKKFSGVKYIPNQVKNIDVCIVNGKNSNHHLLWGEAKNDSTPFDLMLTQLVLTIYKATKGETILPPKVVCCFNAEYIWFVPYNIIQGLLNTTDVDWTATPSNHKAHGFRQLNKVVNKTITNNNDIRKFDFQSDLPEIKKFVENKIFKGLDDAKIAITHNNFVAVFHKWESAVLPHIKITNSDWKKYAKDKMLMPRDFFMAGLFVENGETCYDAIRRVHFKNNGYQIKEHFGMFQELSAFIEFDDEGKAATEFWNNYKRPPHKSYWNDIFSRIDLLVPADIRSMKGAYFTPQIWVEKAMEYLTDVLGNDWQNEYYIWDCACGTGNLLLNLINPDRVFASDNDDSNIRIIHGNIDNEISNLHKGHVFNFDFLNEKIDKIPAQKLVEILKDKEKRKKLLFFINPPWGEAGNKKSITTGAKSKGGIEQTNQNELRADKFGGKAMKEVSAQFLARIYTEFSGCVIGEYSYMKVLTAPNFVEFRERFKAELMKCFMVPANTFDNVTGDFPAGFCIWDTKSKKAFKSIIADTFDKNGNAIGQKYIINQNKPLINTWNKPNKVKEVLFYLNTIGADFQHQTNTYIINCKRAGGKWNPCETIEQATRLLVEYSVRRCIPSTWLNNRDLFLVPADTWESDKAFQADCVVWGMFRNAISIELGENHLNPYTASEAGCPFAFGSKFGNELVRSLELTEDSQSALNAGALLCKHYYKTNSNAKPGASIADIRRYFKQGKHKSTDETFNVLNKDLTEKCNVLQENIRVGTYKHGFLEA